MDGKLFHFAFAADEKFAFQLQVAASSLLKSAIGIKEVQHLHILDCGITDSTWRDLRRTIASFAGRFGVECEINRLVVDMSLFARFRNWNASKATYARLLLPKLLPDLRYCVYSDCDVLFFDNPWPLAQQLEKSGVAVLGHRNPVGRDGRTMDEQWFADHGEPYNRSTYFCAGLIAMDLDRFRAPGVLDSMFEFLARHTDVVSADQTALNWYFRNDSALATGGWGLFPSECFCDPSVIHAIHYSGGTPWKKVCSWYEFVMYRQVDDIWLTFVQKAFGRDLRGGRVSAGVLLSGGLAIAATKFLLSFGTGFPRIGCYLKEARSVFLRNKELAAARDRLMSGI